VWPAGLIVPATPAIRPWARCSALAREEAESISSGCWGPVAARGSRMRPLAPAGPTGAGLWRKLVRRQRSRGACSTAFWWPGLIEASAAPEASGPCWRPISAPDAELGRATATGWLARPVHSASIGCCASARWPASRPADASGSSSWRGGVGACWWISPQAAAAQLNFARRLKQISFRRAAEKRFGDRGRR